MGQMEAILYLEDGTRFVGKALGATGTAVGEVVVQTSMSGLREILVDPTYAGHVVLMTYPLAGNSGLLPLREHEPEPALQALIVNEPDGIATDAERLCLDEWLRRYGIVGLYGIDTRQLARHLRDHGAMRGVLVSGSETVPPETVKTLLQAAPAAHPVERVSTRCVQRWSPQDAAPRRTVVVLDFGVKRSFVEALLQAGCQVIQAPYNTDLDTIASWSPDGVFLSNGPGDPRELSSLLPTIAALVERYPLFGVGLGPQLLALACGGQVQKMHLGHHGTNYPVLDVETGKGWITSQHHSYEVVEASLEDTGLVVTHRLLHDRSVEGLRHKTRPAFSVQFHPDAHPGPTDTCFLLQEFVRMMDDQRGGMA